MQNLYDWRKYPDDRMRTERTCDCGSCLEEMWERMTFGGVQTGPEYVSMFRDGRYVRDLIGCSHGWYIGWTSLAAIQSHHATR